MVLKLTISHYRFLFWACLIAVFILATMPLHMPQFELSFADKLNHIFAFSVLFILFKKSYEVTFWVAFGMLVTYGFLLECIQRFIPYRDFSWMDLIADAVGLSIGFIISFFITQLIDKDNV